MWDCAEQLETLLPSTVPVRKLAEPIRMLDQLEGCERIVILDACLSGAAIGSLVRLEWPDPRIGAGRPGSTHNLELGDVLRLAARLGKLPPRVVVFGLEVRDVAAGAEPNDELLAALPTLVRRVQQEIVTMEWDA